MPLYAYHCPCGYSFTEMFTMNGRPDTLACPKCGDSARYRISVSTVDCASECPSWLKDTIKTVAPENGPHCTEFIRNPTRENYHRWMKGEGIRPYEKGERKKPKAITHEERKRYVKEQFMKRNRICL